VAVPQIDILGYQAGLQPRGEFVGMALPNTFCATYIFLFPEKFVSKI